MRVQEQARKESGGVNNRSCVIVASGVEGKGGGDG